MCEIINRLSYADLACICDAFLKDSTPKSGSARLCNNYFPKIRRRGNLLRW